MFEYIGKFLVKKYVQEEISKLKTDILNVVEKAKTDAISGNAFKVEAYKYADGILAEGQAVSKEKLDQWWIDKRNQLKLWSGQ